MERALLIATRTSLALVLLAPLIVMAKPLPSTFFPFIVGKALYARLLIQIAFGLWVILALRYPQYRPPRSWLLGIFAVYVIVALFAAYFGVSPQRSLWSTYERMQGVVDLAHFLAFTVVLVSTFRTWATWFVLLNVNLGISLLMSGLGLAQLSGIPVLVYLSNAQRLDITLGNPTYVGAYMLVNVLVAMGFLGGSLMTGPLQAATGPPVRKRRRGRGRAARADEPSRGIWWVFLAWVAAVLLSVLTLLITSATWALILLGIVFVAFAASYFAFSEPMRRAWWNAFWVIVIVVASMMLYLSATRGALFGLAVGLIAVAAGYALWGADRRVRAASMLMVAALIGLAVIFFAVVGTESFQKFSKSNIMLTRLAVLARGDDSLKGRIDSARVGLRGFAARPILGWGPENFTIAYDRYVTSDIVAVAVTSFDQAHNKPIEELTTKGVLGFLAYISLWVYMGWLLVTRVRRMDPPGQMFTFFVGAALVAYFAQNLFLFDTPGTVTQFILLLGFMGYVDTVAPNKVAAAEPRATDPPAERPATEGLVFLRSPVSFVGASFAVAALVLVTMYYLEYRPFLGARTVINTLDQSLTWDQRLEQFERSIDAFPPLANYPRIVMFNQLHNGWPKLVEEEVAGKALLAAEMQGLDARTGEPEEWRVYMALASLYQRAGGFDPTYVPKARELVDVAAELAPDRIEIVQRLVRQDMIERDFEKALARIDAYVGKTPESVHHFAGLRQQVEKAIAQ